MRIVNSRDHRSVAALLSPARGRDRATERRAAAIGERVRRGGDPALVRFARSLDGLEGAIEVSKDDWERRAGTLPVKVRRAIRAAARNIRRVARAQKPRPFTVTVAPGIRVEQRIVPLERVGCYVPAGRYPLPSSLLMTAVPARTAGVGEIVIACPRPDAAVFAAAVEAGADRLFRMGGAHAVAALACGTRSVPRVDKIVGPGNRWVAAAKAIVARDCSIDFFAGPTEIVTVAGSG